ncbi:MAG: PrsW family glutamic-type intramembrane protease [bacterium]
MGLELNTVLFAFLGGLLPTIIWLIFWLEEDKKRPEPNRLILRTFVLGMIAVLLVLPFQKFVDDFLPGLGIVAFLLWAILEESFKFGAAYWGGLKSVEDNEPIDPLIYMITAALGFVALENTLFIVAPLLEQDLLGQNIVTSIITGNFRFIGAGLLHTVSSGIIGLTLGLSFYKPRILRRYLLILAFTLAVIFHTVFNLAISHNVEIITTIAFGSVWLGVVLLILFFEKVKTIAPSEQKDII